MSVPDSRIRTLVDEAVSSRGDFVLYWMTSFRRARSNFALDRAIEHGKALGKPVVVFEPLRIGYPYANDRLHTFILQGMEENDRRFAGSAVTYFPYVETEVDEDKGLLDALLEHACVLVGDDWPSFFVPQMQKAVAKRCPVRFEVVDSNGLYPMHDTERVFTTAHSFRTHLQKVLPPHLMHMPRENPLEGVKLPTLAHLPAEVTKRWPRASKEMLAGKVQLPIDHTVRAVPIHGGSAAGEARLSLFVSRKLNDYQENRSEPEVDGTSVLSPYLHFGHVSSQQVFATLVRHEKWDIEKLGKSIGGAKEGWWKMSPPGEAFMDQLVTWRELAFNMSSHDEQGYHSLSSLPAFAKETIAKHAKDKREHLYTREQLEQSQTHDPLWNATMGQLREDGWFHNYLRMLWGKKIYQWSRSAEEALGHMEYLMGKYSLDGRDPVSWSGYLWVLGRYDRAWGPEREVFGKLRYMTSENTARKISVKHYIEKYT